MKFGRKYKLTIELENGKALEVASPLTCEFNIERTYASSLNQAVFKVYNLSLKNRNQLFQTRFTSARAGGKRKSIVFQAGYDNLTTCFKGSILEAYSFRQGVDVITYINAQDGGYQAYTSTANLTLSAGETFLDGFKKIAATMGLQIGSIGKTEGEYKRGKPVAGNTFYLLSKDFKNEFFIDLEKINKLAENEYIKSSVFEISSQTGLLGTPIIQGASLVVNTLFEPQINVANVVAVKSLITPKYDGQYKVMGVSHTGIISEAQAGDATTTLQLLAGTKLTGELQAV